jgi:hypothetical protein
MAPSRRDNQHAVSAEWVKPAHAKRLFDEVVKACKSDYIGQLNPGPDVPKEFYRFHEEFVIVKVLSLVPEGMMYWQVKRMLHWFNFDAKSARFAFSKIGKTDRAKASWAWHIDDATLDRMLRYFRENKVKYQPKQIGWKLGADLGLSYSI